MALKLENAGAVAVIQALCVVLSFIFSITILNEPLYLTSALGALFIFLSVVFLSVAKMFEEMRNSCMKNDNNNINNKNKKGFKFQFNFMQNFNTTSSLMKLKKSKSFDILHSYHQDQHHLHNHSQEFPEHKIAHLQPPLSTDNNNDRRQRSCCGDNYNNLAFTVDRDSTSISSTGFKDICFQSLYHQILSIKSEPYLLRIAPISINNNAVDN